MGLLRLDFNLSSICNKLQQLLHFAFLMATSLENNLGNYKATSRSISLNNVQT